MKTKTEYKSETYNIVKEENLKKSHSYCKSGHIVYWYGKPLPDCPFCKADLLPEGEIFYKKSSFPWLSAFKYG